MDKTYSFEKLETWQDARKFVSWIYRITVSFPINEQYGITSQIKRASISIVSNLAEGSGRKTPKDQAYFYQISYSSAIEVLNLLIIASDNNIISEDLMKEGRAQIEKITFKINALRNACYNK